MSSLSRVLVCAACLVGFVSTDLHAQNLRVEILEGAGTAPLPARVHVLDAQGKPVKVTGYPAWDDHFVCEGEATIGLKAGRYRIVVERGPEYRPFAKDIEIVAEEMTVLQVRLDRIADLAAEGWYSGELHVHRKPEDVERLLKAEDLYVVNVITWWNEHNSWRNNPPPANPLIHTPEGRYYHLMGGEDERGGGALLFANMPSPIKITGSAREYPSSLKYLDDAWPSNPHVDIEKPFWWDTPLWLASGKVHTVGIAHNHMNRLKMYENEAWGKPRDESRLPPPRGNGLWTQEIYYHILESGLRIPPSAGSASGVLPNPVGYNRVYVHTQGELDYEKWWEGLRKGRSFVTNGPLLRVKANGQWPGHVFESNSGGVKIRLDMELASNDPIKVVEIIRNGRVVQEIKPLKSGGWEAIHPLIFDQSGWFLVRAIADVPHTFRFASTAPFYVVVDQKQRVSQASVRFFLDWISERRNRIEKAVADPNQRAEVMSYLEASERYWLRRLEQATAP